MPVLIFADKASLLLAGKHAPDLLAEYAEVKRTIGHDFRHGFKIATVQESLQRGEECGPPKEFVM